MSMVHMIDQPWRVKMRLKGAAFTDSKKQLHEKGSRAAMKQQTTRERGDRSVGHVGPGHLILSQ